MSRAPITVVTGQVGAGKTTLVQKLLQNLYPDLDLEATEACARHRLCRAGGTGQEFSTEAIEMIYWQPGGVPRLINKLADFGMVHAVTAEKNGR